MKIKNFRPKTILITGSAGFIGSKTAEALRKQGYNVRLFTGNVGNIADWKNSLANVDVVFHAAGIRTETEKDFDVNVKGTENLFKVVSEGVTLLRKETPPIGYKRSLPAKQGETLQKPKRVILASSQAVYSGNTPPYVETMRVDPITLYGKSKYEAEKIAQEEGKRLGIDVVILRYAAVLGPGIREESNMSGSLARWVKAGIKGDPIVVYKDPNRVRNYIHIDDVVSANVLAVSTLPPGIYNVCGDEKIKLIDLAEMIKKITGGISEVSIASVPLAPGDSGDQTASNLKLKSFGWRPSHTIEEAVREYVGSVKLKARSEKL